MNRIFVIAIAAMLSQFAIACVGGPETESSTDPTLAGEEMNTRDGNLPSSVVAVPSKTARFVKTGAADQRLNDVNEHAMPRTAADTLLTGARDSQLNDSEVGGQPLAAPHSEQ